MVRRLPHLWILIVNITLSFASEVALNSMPVEAAELESRIVIQRDVRPGPFSSSARAEGFVDRVYEEKQKIFARGVSVRFSHDAGKTYPRGKSDGYAVGYPDLVAGDTVPLIGGFYRVLSMSGSGRGTSVVFEILDSHETPESWKSSKDTYIFPLGLGGSSWLHQACFVATVADMSGDGTPAVPAVDVKILSYYRKVNGVGVSGSGRTQTVRVGDLIELGEFRHRVVSIVRPEPKKKIVGWFAVQQIPENASSGTEK